MCPKSRIIRAVLRAWSDHFPKDERSGLPLGPIQNSSQRMVSMRIPRMIRLHAAAAVSLLLVVSAYPPSIATGDSRNVTEPVFPPVCTRLFAHITEVENDIPAAV